MVPTATKGHTVEMYTTFEQAEVALAQAEADVVGDMGEEAVDECWADIVDSVAQFCTPEVRREVRRTTGTFERG